MSEEEQQYQDQEQDLALRESDDSKSYEGYPRFIIREQDRWLPIANGKYF